MPKVQVSGIHSLVAGITGQNAPTRSGREAVIVIHEADCPALCQSSFCDGENYFTECRASGHAHHRCQCAAPTAEQLRELVENANAALRFMKDFDKFGPNFGHGISSIRLETMVVDLGAALKPFRKGGEEKA